MRQVTVRTIDNHSYTVEADNGRGHVFASDEPQAEGGQDLGPTPQELLIASLGGCVAITLRMYAERHDWLLEEITVHVTSEDVIPTEPEFTPDAIEFAGPSGKLPLVRSHVTIKGDLDETQRARLEQIAGRCPIHRFIHGPNAIVTTLTLDA